jgi:transmembrane sensor
MAGGGMAVAAGIAAAVLPALVAQPAIGAYATGRGQHRHVVLADGTALDLNAETRVTVRLSRHSRQVELAEGEAIFDVVHDERRPFTVLAAGREIRDVGTQFDVKARGGALTVTVAKGKVEVRPEAASSAARAYLLSPGERLAVGASGAVRLASVDASETFSWRVGRLVYREQPLSEVVADLNRQFTTQIEIGDPELAQIPITGVVVLDDPAAVMSRLSLMLPIRSVPSDKGLTLLRK